MLYPYTLEQKLGFDKIRQLLSDLCLSSLGVKFVEKMRFQDRYDQVVKMQAQVMEMQYLLSLGAGFPTQNYIDGHPFLDKIALEGNYLNEQEFFDFYASLKTIYDCQIFIEKQEGLVPNLLELAQNTKAQEADNEVFNLKAIFEAIGRTIDERGKIRDNASPELQRIRKSIYSVENDLRKRLDSIFKHARNSGWISDDFSLAVRNGRLVIPIAAEYKRKLKGFIHDETESGKTVFIEPAEILDANNELKELEALERREIIKILTQLSNSLRPYVAQLRRCYIFLGLIDFIRAKALFCSDIQAISPMVHKQPLLRILAARHPLLWLNFRKIEKKVVPLTVQLPEGKHILLVSGPNAGGKSVMLKTIGLLQYMLQSGLLVPVAEGTEMGVFRHIFIDMGDEQSLENDLSTYSSHLSNMKFFLENAQAQTLFLIDEFGTGTEPSLGGAIAEAILQELAQSKAFGIINTHYTNLKSFAEKHTGTVNGAMRFDAEHLEPMFELEIGQPGSSFALEIAHKIGLKKKVIHEAKQKLGNKQVNFEKLLKELEIEKKVFAEKNLEFTTKQRELDQLLHQYQQLKDLLDNQKKTIVNTAKQEAKELVKAANQKIEQVIKDIKEVKADKETTKLLRDDLKSFETKKLVVEKPNSKPETEKIVVEKGEITVGSLVRIKGQETVAEVINIKEKDAEVAIGGLKSFIKLNRLEKISRKEYNSQVAEEPKKSSNTASSMNEKMMNFTFNLDIRGKRGEEALQVVDGFIDDAIMLGYPELRIVHGKGDGILRNLIRNHLKRYKQVGAMVDDHADRGGAGVTVVSMR